MHKRWRGSGPQEQEGFTPDFKKCLTFLIPSKALSPEGLPEWERRKTYWAWFGVMVLKLRCIKLMWEAYEDVDSSLSPHPTQRIPSSRKKPRICIFDKCLRHNHPKWFWWTLSHSEIQVITPRSALLASITLLHFLHPLHFLIYYLPFWLFMSLTHSPVEWTAQMVKIYACFAPWCIPNGQNRVWSIEDLGKYLLKLFELKSPSHLMYGLPQ